MATREYTFRFERDDDGGFVAQCNEIPGVITEGDTFEELLSTAREALLAMLESRAKRRDMELRQLSSTPWFGVTVHSASVAVA